jgi:hypothetical protein
LISAEMRARAMNAVGHQDMEYRLADELRAVMGDELLQQLTVVGTADDVDKKVAELASVPGVSELIINVHAKDPALTFSTFRDRVIPNYGG